jgi:hypothetical protein
MAREVTDLDDGEPWVVREARDPGVPERAAVAERIRLRLKLGLRHRDCAMRSRPPDAESCICLSDAVDAVLESGEPRPGRTS